MKKKQPIVYSALIGSERGSRGVRLALRPVLDNESCGAGPRFPCRVLYGFTSQEATLPVPSCRSRVRPLKKDFDAASTDPIAWLLEGER